MVTLPSTNPFSDLSDFYLRNLVSHLLGANKLLELHRILEMKDISSGSNAWYDAKRSIDDMDGYAKDIRQAWLCTDATFADPRAQSGLPCRIGLQIRYALFLTSLNSFNFGIPGEFIKTAVQHGLMSCSSALSEILRIPDEKRRVSLLEKVLPLLPPDSVLAILKTSTTLGEEHRSELLRTITPRLATQGHMDKVIQAALTIQKERYRVSVFQSIILHLPEEFLDRVETEISFFFEAEHKAQLLKSYCTRLAALGFQERALHIALSIKESYFYKTIALTAALPMLSSNTKEKIRPTVLGYAYKIKSTGLKIAALKALLPLLSGDMAKKVIADTLYLVRTSMFEERLQHYADVVPHAPDKLRQSIVLEACALANDIGFTDIRVPASQLAHMSKNLSAAGHFAEALDTVFAIPQFFIMVNALESIASQLPESYIYDALARGRSISHKTARTLAILAVASRLAPTRRKHVMEEVTSTLFAISDNYEKVAVVAAMAKAGPLDSFLIDSCFNEIDVLEKSFLLKGGMELLVPLLTEQQLRLTLMKVLREENKDNRIRAMRILSPYLPKSLIQEAIEQTHVIGDYFEYVSALAELAPSLSCNQRSEINKSAHVIIYQHNTRDEKTRCKALLKIAPFLSEAIQNEVVVSASSICGDEYRSYFLSCIAPHLAPRLRYKVLMSAWHLVRHINKKELESEKENNPTSLFSFSLDSPFVKDENRTRTLKNLVREFSKIGERKLALKAAGAIRPRIDRQRALLSNEKEYKKPRLLKRILKKASKISPPYYHHSDIRSIRELAEKGRVSTALKLALSIKTDFYKIRALSNLLPFLKGKPLIFAVEQGLELISALKQDTEQTRFFLEFMPYLSQELSCRLLEEKHRQAMAIPDDKHRSLILAMLCPHLPLTLLKKTLNNVLFISDSFEKENAVKEIAKRLCVLGCGDEAIGIVRNIKFKQTLFEALNDIIPHLSMDLRLPALSQALDIACHRDLNFDKQLAKLSKPLSELEPAVLYPLWQRALHQLTMRHDRKNFTIALIALLPVIKKLDSGSVISDLATAIADAQQYWP